MSPREKNSHAHALVLSGGVGRRFSASQPKQFALLQKKPLFIHSLEAFLSWPKIKEICLTVPAEHIEKSQKLLRKFLKDHEKIQVICGAKTRHLSSLCGLKKLLEKCHPDDLVFVHDAARPMVQRSELQKLQDALENSSSLLASLALRITETVVEAEGWHRPATQALDRSRLYAVKTPQAAYARVLKEMMKNNQQGNRQENQQEENFTDLLTWAMRFNIKGVLVEAEPYNMKVTSKDDLHYLEAVLRNRT